MRSFLSYKQGLRVGMRDYTVPYVMCLQMLLKLAVIHPPSKEEADEIGSLWKLISSASYWIGRASLSRI